MKPDFDLERERISNSCLDDFGKGQLCRPKHVWHVDNMVVRHAIYGVGVVVDAQALAAEVVRRNPNG